MRLKPLKLMAATAMLAAPFVFGQGGDGVAGGENINGAGLDGQNPSTNANSNIGSAGKLAELYYQLQLLQEEVLQLRGIVDEQSFQIKKLKQQRLDDYVDLDRRLSQLGSSGGTNAQAGSPVATSPALSTNSSVSKAPASGVGQSTAASTTKGDEFKAYKEAYRLATQDPAAAEVALKEYMQAFPNSRYLPNSLFVLGEIKLKSGDLEDSRAWFMRVILEHPEHYRAANAKLKLGKVYHLMGDMVQAKKYWTEVASTKSNAAVKAKENLATYFPN